ncbi:hypothetical protein ACLB2K_036947 [Fragaria x ananassa]
MYVLRLIDSFLVQKHSSQSAFWLVFIPSHFSAFACFYQVFSIHLVFPVRESCALVIMDDNYQGIRGDGRCLFRSVVHGACLRAGKPSPSDSYQKELADDLRAKVADEFIKRRADTEWFLEDDFESYVVQMRKPHIWGGEPELLMSSHVLQIPITVYMRDKNSRSLRIIAEYGQEYGNDNPIRVLYHGYGHYDALRGPTPTTGAMSKQL